MIKLEERFDNYYKKLEQQINESVKNIYEFVVVEKNDNSFRDTVEAYSYKQAQFLAHDKYEKCLIRDMRQITDNKDKDGQQIGMFDDKQD